MRHNVAVEVDRTITRAFCSCGWTTTAARYTKARDAALAHQAAHPVGEVS